MWKSDVHHGVNIVGSLYSNHLCAKSLKIPNGQSESVKQRRTENTMTKRKRTKEQTTIDLRNTTQKTE